jgi:hypothetical protein
METEIKIATNIRCLYCERKLCKIRDYASGPMVELKHKGAMLLTKEALVKCMGCQRMFQVNADSNICQEIEIG